MSKSISETVSPRAKSWRAKAWTSSALSALGVAAALSFAGVAHAAPSPFDAEVSFGDSLSDNGNIWLASGLPGAPHRFTTNPGNVTVEYVASHYNLTLNPSLAGGSDNAFGGAGINNNSPGTPLGVPTITTQVGGYLAAHPALDGHTLYTMWGGANDIFYHATLVAFSLETPLQAQNGVIAAATQEGQLIGAMRAHGANYIVVFNLPDIGLTPSGIAQGPAAQAQLTALSAGYNGVLNNALGVIGTGIVPVDTFDLIHEVAAHPAAFGLTNVTSPACGALSSLFCTSATLVAPNADTTYLFADGVHPTSKVHAMLADVVISELEAPQLVSLLGEAPLATSAAQRQAMTNQLDLDPAEGGGVRLYATGGYGWRTFKAQDYTPETKANGGTVTVGFDSAVSENLTIGAMVTGVDSSLGKDGDPISASLRQMMGSVYGQYRLGGAYLDASVGGGQLKLNDIMRTFNIGPLMRTEAGETSGSDLSASIGLGWWFDLGGWKAGPYAAWQYDKVRVNGYSEISGDSTAMVFGDQTRESSVGEIGLRVRGATGMGGMNLRPYLAVAYDHDTRAQQAMVRAGLVNMNGTFVMPGYTPDKNWATLQLGVTADLGADWSASVGYTGRYSDQSQSFNAATITVSRKF